MEENKELLEENNLLSDAEIVELEAEANALEKEKTVEQKSIYELLEEEIMNLDISDCIFRSNGKLIPLETG